MAHATFKIGDLTAVIGDNTSDGEHRAGYNGLWSLRHKSSSRSLFVPTVAGLNYEHIFNGDAEDAPKIFFEDHVWMPMFDRADGIRMSHSPSGGGNNAEYQTTNPAWDFQFIVLNYDVMKPYGSSFHH